MSFWEIIRDIPKQILLIVVIVILIIIILGILYSITIPCTTSIFGLKFGPEKPCPQMPLMPSGIIMPYIGNHEDIPEGWSICGDEESPNLDGLFLVGTRDLGKIGETTGDKSHEHRILVKSTFEVDGTKKGPEGADNYTGPNNWNHKHMVKGTTISAGHIPPAMNVLFLCSE